MATDEPMLKKVSQRIYCIHRSLKYINYALA